MVKSEVIVFRQVDSIVHSIQLQADKLAALPGETVNFTVKAESDDGIGIARRVGEVWVNGAFQRVTPFTDSHGECRFALTFPLPLIYQVDVRFYNGVPPYVVKSNVVTLLI